MREDQRASGEIVLQQRIALVLSAGIPRPACMSTTARRPWSVATRFAHGLRVPSVLPKASVRGRSLIRLAPASRWCRAAGSPLSSRGCTRHSA